jgi:acyl carrier protein
MKKVGAARGRFAGQEAGKGAAGGQQGMFAEGGMKPEQGVEVLRRVLSRLRKPQVVVSPRDVAAVRRQLAEAGAVSAQAAPERRVGPESKHPRPQLSTPYVAPTNPTEERLVEVWQDVLGLEQVGIHDNFFDLGGDSVMGITVISQAAEAGLELAPEQLFEHQTVAELAELLGGADADAEGVEAAGEEEEDHDDAGLDEDELAKVLDKLDDIT